MLLNILQNTLREKLLYSYYLRKNYMPYQAAFNSKKTSHKIINCGWDNEENTGEFSVSCFYIRPKDVAYLFYTGYTCFVFHFNVDIS